MKGIFHRIGINTSIQVLGKIISTVLSFITVGLLTRYLGKEGFGNFTLVFTYLAFFGFSADLGLQLTMVREIAKDKNISSKFYGSFFWLKLFLVFFSTLLALTILSFFPYSRFLKTAIILATLGVGLGNLNNFGTVIFQANLRMDLVTLIDLMAKIFTTGLIIIYVFFKSSFFNLINTVLIGNIVASFLIYILLQKFVKFDLSFDFRLIKKLLFKSLPIGLVSFLVIFYFKVDTLILSIYRSSSDVGIYSLAYKIIENLLMLWSYYMASVYPLLASFHKENINKKKLLWNKSIITALISSGIIILIGYFFAPLAIKILGGQEFKESILVLRILLFSIPFFFINNLYYHLLLVEEQTGRLLKIMFLSLSLNLILNLLFIPFYGYLPAAYNTIITEMIILVFYITSLSSK